MNLPTELYARIFEHLRLNDRIEISNVSKLFNQLNRSINYTRQVSISKMIEFPEYIVNIGFANFYHTLMLKYSIH
jgi:hypothetical protein